MTYWKRIFAEINKKWWNIFINLTKEEINNLEFNEKGETCLKLTPKIVWWYFLNNFCTKKEINLDDWEHF